MPLRKQKPTIIDRCPNWLNHTQEPEGYLDWHAWAEDMNKKGFVQIKCHDCGLFKIWIKK